MLSIIVFISCKVCASGVCRLSVCRMNRKFRQVSKNHNISIGTDFRLFDLSGSVSPTKPDRASTRALDC